MTGVAFKFALSKIRIIKFKNLVCFCCCKGSGVNGCELSTVYFKQIRSCGCQVAIVAFMDGFFFFYWFHNLMGFFFFKIWLPFQIFFFCNRLCVYLQLIQNCFPCPCNRLFKLNGLIAQRKAWQSLSRDWNKGDYFSVGISLNIFSVKLFVYLNEDKSFTLLAFCSSAESKKLTNFVICHLPNCLDFVSSLTKLIFTWLISEINVWIHFTVFYKNAKSISKLIISRKFWVLSI